VGKIHLEAASALADQYTKCTALVCCCRKRCAADLDNYVKKRILVALLVGSHYQATATPSEAAKFVSSPPLAVATPCSMTSSLRVKQDRGFLILDAE